ncbi:MAG: Rne/Rng family ribonuclease [Phormidesmis sp.]
MPKQIVIAEQHRIAAVFSEDQIQEIIVATGSHQVGDIYLGKVENILPGIDACFVNIGDSDKNGFMHVSDLGPLKLKRMASSITELLAPQQKVLVQIMKEPTGNKGPRLTGKVTLPGRYLVLMPYGKGVNLSRRIRNETERNRLRALGILVKPPGMGLLIRTEAEGVSEDAIIEDLEALQKRWETIQQEAMATRPPSLLNRDDDFIQKVLRDVYNDDVNRIVTDTASGLARTKQHLTGWSDGRIPTGILIDDHTESTPILEYFRVNAAIREALKPRVDLPSGGYVIIEPTEALTVIDVNSGSFTRSATARETVLWTNCEAAVEIARQLKLRNIAGVIIVDFIDMESRRDQMQVLEQFGASLRSDKSRPQISQLSELGLVELTRKRQGQNIYELFGQTCPTCGGLGHLAHLPGDAPPAALTSGSGRSQGYSAPSQSFSSRPSAKEDRPVTASPATANPITTSSITASLDSQSELQTLDLLNHPNYQDKNGRSGRRRRRRGSEGSSRNARSSAPAPVTNSRDSRESDERINKRRGRVDRADRADIGDRQDRADRVADRASESSAEDRLDASLDSTQGDISTRGKRTRNGRRKSEEPPEIIAVEMPEEEQRIYAMMGISPIVYSEQVVENPQNAVISVVLPGEAEQFMAAAKAAAELAIANKKVITTRTHTEPEQSPEFDEETESESIESAETTDDAEPTAKSIPVRKRKRDSNRPVTKADAATEDKNQAELATEAAEGSAEVEDPQVVEMPTIKADRDGAEQNERALEEPEKEEKIVRRRRRRRSSASE